MNKRQGGVENQKNQVIPKKKGYDIGKTKSNFPQNKNDPAGKKKIFNPVKANSFAQQKSYVRSIHVGERTVIFVDSAAIPNAKLKKHIPSKGEMNWGQAMKDYQNKENAQRNIESEAFGVDMI